MINGNLDQFLDTGWFNEAEIYYKGHIYWCEGYFTKDNRFHFFIRKWKVKIVEEVYYVTLLGDDNDLIDYDDSFSIEGKTMDEVKQKFLTSPIWEGKTFWEVEKELAWYDYDGTSEKENKCEK